MGQRTEQGYIKESRETKYRSVGRNFTGEDCPEDGSQSNGTDIRIGIRIAEKRRERGTVVCRYKNVKRDVYSEFRISKANTRGGIKINK